MKLTFDGDGGHVVLDSGRDGTTELEVERDGGEILISMEATNRHQVMTLGVGMSRDEALAVADELVTLAEGVADLNEENE